MDLERLESQWAHGRGSHHQMDLDKTEFQWDHGQGHRRQTDQMDLQKVELQWDLGPVDHQVDHRRNEFGNRHHHHHQARHEECGESTLTGTVAKDPKDQDAHRTNSQTCLLEESSVRWFASGQRRARNTAVAAVAGVEVFRDALGWTERTAQVSTSITVMSTIAVSMTGAAMLRKAMGVQVERKSLIEELERLAAKTWLRAGYSHKEFNH